MWAESQEAKCNVPIYANCYLSLTILFGVHILEGATGVRCQGLLTLYKWL